MNTTVKLFPLPSGQTLELVSGDLTQERVDAIVNAANSRLQHGGGVAGAIVRAGGRVIQQESDAWVREHGQVSHASPAYTTSGALPCRFIIHAVGPVWGSGDEDQKLAAAVTGSLETAQRLGLTSIAMPPLSTGIFGFPKKRAAKIFKETILAYFQRHPQSGLKTVRLTVIDRETLEIFEAAWQAN